MTDEFTTTKGLGWIDGERMKKDYDLVQTYLGMEKPFDVQTAFTHQDAGSVDQDGCEQGEEMSAECGHFVMRALSAGIHVLARHASEDDAMAGDHRRSEATLRSSQRQPGHDDAELLQRHPAVFTTLFSFS